MNFQSFKRVLETFADTPVDVDARKGQLMAQIREEVIEARIALEEGAVQVIEGDQKVSAERWIIDRVAKLRLLAERILTHIPAEPNFVIPSGKLMDAPDYTGSTELVQEDNSVASCGKVLGRHPAGTASILYVTSDAGEGKTTLINHLARMQAEAYKKKQTSWVLLPVPLGGRPFMRFDEVIIAALVNRFRFPNLYFESFLELVRMGVIVPAFDGFEEMFIENAGGDAASALGNLVHMLDSSGSVLIAARKAYFDYNSLAASSRLFDALGDTAVTFSKITLDRWTKPQFLDYCAKRKIPQGEEIYSDVSRKLGPTHPLLTRAVLVKRLLDVATSEADRQSLLDKLEPRLYFSQFVDTIVNREASEKWINKSGEPPAPLMSISEHYELLSMLAQEMWDAGRSTVGVDLIDTVARLFCDKRKKNVTESRQIVERIKQHALIIEEEGGKRLYGFDHEEFYHYFLGEALFQITKDGTDSDLRRIMRPRALPALALETATSLIHTRTSGVEAVARRILAACNSDERTSFARENAGGLILRLLDGVSHGPIKIEGLSLPMSSLEGRRLENIEFVRCYFQQTLFPTSVARCRFAECEFEALRTTEQTHVEATVFVANKVHSFQRFNSEAATYDPDQIDMELEAIGGQVGEMKVARLPSSHREPDEEIVIIDKILRVFLRATQINDYHLSNRMGKRAARFRKLLPDIERVGILKQTAYHGAENFKYYRLGLPMSDISEALEKSDGKFLVFLDALKKHPKR